MTKSQKGGDALVPMSILGKKNGKEKREKKIGKGKLEKTE